MSSGIFSFRLIVLVITFVVYNRAEDFKPSRNNNLNKYSDDDNNRKSDQRSSYFRNQQFSASASAVPGGCPPQFGGRCACEYRTDKKYDPNPRKQKYFVDCDTSGFRNTSMLEYLPVQTEVLIFTGNQLPFLRSNIFGKESRTPNLRIIDMSNNQITEIDGKAFHHVESVEILSLAHNSISNSSLHKHPRLFSNFYSLKELFLTNTFDDEVWSFKDLSEIFRESNLTKLEKIHLGLNEITIIPDPSAFCSLPSLRQLYIPQNYLTDDLMLNTSCLPNLDVIDLRQNKIKTITPKSNIWKLLKLKNGKNEDIRLELLANPFRCDCNLKSFISWLRAELIDNPDRIRDNENLICESGSPANNTHMYLRKVEVTSCDPLVISTTAANVANGVVWTLVILLVFAVAAIGYACRYAVLRKVSPLIHAASSGVHYTSIDRTETAEITPV